ncbi:MAG: hypothetical protein AAGM21_01555 [Pseudomonadota bacterium]
MTDPNAILDLSARFPAVDHSALTASATDVKDLIDHLASAHDLTLSEAAEAIDEWQAGLAMPAAARAKAA